MRCIIAAIFALGLAAAAQAADFYAYYTRLDYVQPQSVATLAQIPLNALKVFRGGRTSGTDDQPDEAAPVDPRPGKVRWGKYADLVVNVGDKQQLVFSRATGYLPYLETPKGKFSLKQLVACKDDPMCLCSYVRIVEQSPERIIVHWRHVPDPASVVMTETIQEYFSITPDGKVRREVRAGASRLDDFNDPANVTVQELSLTADGVTELSLNKARRSADEQQVDVGPELEDRRPARLRRAHGRQTRTVRSCQAHRKHRCPRGRPLAVRVY